jgi:hypothetical protein
MSASCAASLHFSTDEVFTREYPLAADDAVLEARGLYFVLFVHISVSFL